MTDYAVAIVYNNIKKPTIKFSPMKLPKEYSIMHVIDHLKTYHNEDDFIVTAVGTKEYLMQQYSELKEEFFK